jgi:hypothetical protein
LTEFGVAFDAVFAKTAYCAFVRLHGSSLADTLIAGMTAAATKIRALLTGTSVSSVFAVNSPESTKIVGKQSVTDSEVILLVPFLQINFSYAASRSRRSGSSCYRPGLSW